MFVNLFPVYSSPFSWCALLSSLFNLQGTLSLWLVFPSPQRNLRIPHSLSLVKYFFNFFSCRQAQKNFFFLATRSRSHRLLYFTTFVFVCQVLFSSLSCCQAQKTLPFLTFFILTFLLWPRPSFVALDYITTLSLYCQLLFSTFFLFSALFLF